LGLIFSINAWRNRWSHVKGKAAPGKVVIFVAEIEGGEKKGRHSANIIRSLTKALGSSAQIRRARFELRLDKSGSASDDAGVANGNAREYLEEKRGDLLIWGQVLAGSPQIIELRFASAPHDSSNGKRFIFDERIELPTEFGVHLGSAIAALAYSYAAPVKSSGRFVADNLMSTSEKLAKLLEETTLRITDEERALLWYSYAVVEETIGELFQDNLRLSNAIKSYRKLSEIWTLIRFPLRWACIQNNLGNLYQTLGEQNTETELLRTGASLFRDALKVWTRGKTPSQWALAKANLGNSLARIGGRENGIAQLQEARIYLKESLQVIRRESDPLLWALTSADLGNILTEIGKRERSPALLSDATRLISVAIEQMNQERFPLYWATLQNDLGNALMALGLQTGSPHRLKAALTAYAESLRERTRDRSPQDWAITQFNLANTKLHLGKLEGRKSEFVEARNLYRSSLECLSEKTTPLHWAAVQTNLGLALEAIAGTDDLKLFTEAAQAYKSALGMTTPENNPRSSEVAMQNLDRVLQIIKDLRSRTRT
jgi:tetratricopeptide (TPR) repeat protein